MTITEFLEARIAEDEELARAALPVIEEPEDEYDNPWSSEHGEYAARGGDNFRHILHNNPTRVLAECAAKRAIIESAEPTVWYDNHAYGGYTDAMEIALSALAIVYAGHPDYGSEWRP